MPTQRGDQGHSDPLSQCSPAGKGQGLAQQPLTPAETTRTASWVEPPEEELGLKRYLETIRERWLLVVVATVVCMAFAILYLAVAQKTYKATADMLITPVDPSTLPSLPLIRQSADPTRDVATASELITNTDVAARVKNQLDLSDSPQDLLKEVTAEPVASSNIVAVSAERPTREEARNLANAFANQAVAEQTDKLHREIASQFQGLKASLTAPGAATDAGTLAELQALSTGPDPTMRVETLADLPQDPASPRPALTLAGGFLGGLILGIVAAFASQILDPRLRREEQLRRRYRLPILARIPKEESRRDKPLGPRSLSAPAAEAYRTLRATIWRPPAEGKQGQVILVTGASASEGKSTTAINLASSLALTGQDVILIEADLRRPSLSSVLDVRPTSGGVVSVLIEHTRLSQALVTSPTYGPHLRVLLAEQSGSGWVTDLFSIPAADTMVREARRLADFVVIDSPPLNEVIDALPLARQADDVLLVTRLGKTRLDKLGQLADLLAESGIQPIGFAVIGTPRPGRRDYRYYSEPPSQRDRERIASLAASGDRGG
jgi:capsular exopolysaccharide synthesis family protein